MLLMRVRSYLLSSSTIDNHAADKTVGRVGMPFRTENLDSGKPVEMTRTPRDQDAVAEVHNHELHRNFPMDCKHRELVQPGDLHKL